MNTEKINARPLAADEFMSTGEMTVTCDSISENSGSMSSIKRDVKKKSSASTGVEISFRHPAHCSIKRDVKKKSSASTVVEINFRHPAHCPLAW
jgi:hypothetical protein